MPGIKRHFSSVIYILGRVCPPLKKSDLWKAMIQVRWKDIEYFDAAWEPRIRQMATHIQANATVMDLGCGRGILREIVGSANYTGVDYRKRKEDTVVCDFNKLEFPDFPRDVAFVSGCLEYVSDHRWFIAQICDKVNVCVISYCTLETHGDLAGRRRAGWVNDLTAYEIKREFDKHHFGLSVEDQTPAQNAIFVFKRVGGSRRK